MKSQKRREIVWRIAMIALFLLAMIVFFADRWYIRIYGRIHFDSVLFTLTSDLTGTSSTLMLQYLWQGLLPAIAVGAACAVLIIVLRRKTRLKRWIISVTVCVLSVAAIVFSAFDAELVDYIVYSSRDSDVYEKYYVDPNEVQITFPEQKKNLVYIILESMETSFLSEELGGGVDDNLIPELYQLANDNINFSQNGGVGGFRANTGATWTIGSLVSQTGGVPLVTTLFDEKSTETDAFLPGLTTLTDILHENGYYQAFMLGSSAAFGNTGAYYETHGVDKIYEVGTAWDDGFLPKGYWDGWWGMEDYLTFEYAKQELTKIAQKDQPFAFTMMTIDTHHIGGHTCPYCINRYEEQYDNVISCSDRQVAAFVQWLQEQDFYENTTVVIVGDHCSMDASYFRRNVEDDYTRRIYNCILNSSVQSDTTKNREFTTLDLFPTTLAAMGCRIEGDRLGLGTNLFSAYDTLTEQLGYETLCNMLYADSDRYAELFG